MTPSSRSASRPERKRSAPDEHRHAWQRAREHQRLVAGGSDIRQDARAVGHDGDARRAARARVPARQNGRALAALEQQPREVRDDRRLAAAADAEVADADRPGGPAGAPRRDRARTSGAATTPRRRTRELSTCHDQ